MSKQYLSDGVYVDIDVRGLVLTAENGITVSDTIVLDDDGLVALFAFLKTSLLSSDFWQLVDGDERVEP